MNAELTKCFLKEQREQLETDFKSLSETWKNKGKSASVFKLKESIVGPKKTKQEPSSVKDPQTKKEVFDVETIKQKSLDYCVNLLTNRAPLEKYKEDIESKRNVHEERMKSRNNDDEIEYSDDFFWDALAGLKKKGNRKYDFILKSGDDLKCALNKLFEQVWKLETKPEQWRITKIIQLYKGSGSRNELSNLRNINTKEETPKLFGNIVTNLAKPNIISSMTKFQIGTKPGHCAQEHLFVLKSIIGLYVFYGIAVIVQLHNISKFFDREMLRDAMDALYNRGTRGKLYRLLYELNQVTIVKVKTAVGDSEEEDTGEGLGQGTNEGALISASSIDYTVNQQFENSPYEISYGEAALQPMLFQDDLSRMSLTPENAQMGNILMEAVMESKLLDFNLDKSCYMVVGSDRARKAMQPSLERNPQTLCGRNMKPVNQEKYLGDQLCSAGLAASVLATINKRAGRANSAIYEIKAIIEDCRINCVGGLSSGLHVWEIAVIPFLINNSETWVEMNKDAIDKIEDIQNQFLRVLLATPSSTPIPSLCWETGTLTMLNRILMKKLLFYYHILHLDKDTLAKEIATIQTNLGYPGLMTECQDIVFQLQLPDLGINKLSKIQWKSRVKSKIYKKNKEDLLYSIKHNYKKLDYYTLKDESFEMTKLKNI